MDSFFWMCPNIEPSPQGIPVLVRVISFFIALFFLVLPAQSAEDIDIELTPGRFLPGAEIAYAGLVVSMKDGWHVYWKSPGEGGLPPSFKITSSRNLASMAVEWPLPKEFQTNGAISFGYERDVVLPLKLRPMVPDHPIFIDVDLVLYGCSDVCVPFRKHLSVMVAPEDNLIVSDMTDRWLGSVPKHSGQPPLAATLFNNGSILEVDLAAIKLKPLSNPIVDLGTDFVAKFEAINEDNIARFTVLNVNNTPLTGREDVHLLVETFDGSVLSHALSLKTSSPFSPLLLLIAVVAGLILNVMPCVLPVLAIKLAGFTKQDVERRQGFLWTGIGIVSSFVLLSLGVAVLKAAGQAVGWGVQFQSPLFLGSMAVVTVAFAIAMLDGFMIRLPYRATDKLVAFGKGSGRAASFFQGLVATLLATPCSAPFVGTVVGFAFAADHLQLVTIFVFMGIGMALPYFAIYLVPTSRRLIPRSGDWMNKMKVFLALGLVATAGTLLSYLAFSSPAGALALTLILALFLGFILASKLLALLMVATMFAIGLLSYPFEYGGNIVNWQPFEPAAITKAVDEGKSVLVDVTATWCITCKVNETVAFSSPKVVNRLRQADIIAMRADWTLENGVISSYLKSFGRYGIPFTVVYSKAYPHGKVLPEILTPTTLLDAL